MPFLGLKEILFFRLSNSTPKCQEAGRRASFDKFSDREFYLAQRFSAGSRLRDARHRCPDASLRDQMQVI